jgi:hypothetical protein
MLSEPQVETHSTAEPAGKVAPEPPASVELAKCSPQHIGDAGSLQSPGEVQSTMMLPVAHCAPHIVEKSMVFVQQC